MSLSYCIRTALATVLLFSIPLAGCSSLQNSSTTPDTPQGTENASQGLSKDTLNLSDRYDFFDVPVPESYQYTVRKGTRSEDGAPGPEYWQQWTNYDLHARLNPEKRTIEGRGTITYFNNSPDTLYRLNMELAQNMHAKGVQRINNAEVTGGVQLESVVVDGDTLQSDSRRRGGYKVSNTNLSLLPYDEVAPEDSAVIEIAWHFKVPNRGASGRMGYDKDNLYYISYWYPVMSVYDDVDGWFTAPFQGRGEFYYGYGNYDITLEAPEQWLVRSTGQWNNPEEVLQSNLYSRFRQASQSDSVVTIVDSTDFGNITRPDASDNGYVGWHFSADSIRDVAFSATKESIWDAARTPVGDPDGDGQTEYSRVDAVYRTSAPLWSEVAEYSQHSIKFLSEYTGFSYPWPHMTAVEGSGIIGGGMEFPMMTVMGDYNNRGAESLYNVTAHELAHMWVPMIVGTNERKYAWIDEGITTYNEVMARQDRFPNFGHQRGEYMSYLSIAGSDMENPIMRMTDYYTSGQAFRVASYSKPATLLLTLKYMLGDEVFNEALRTFLDEWAYKHPYPWDFFRTFERVAGRDLDWFWHSWYFNTWTLDQAISDMEAVPNGTKIMIKDKGKIPMPVTLTLTLEDGTKIRRDIGVSAWLQGHTKQELIIKHTGKAKYAELDAYYTLPDVNRTNNVMDMPGQ